MSLTPARRATLHVLGEVRRRSGWVRPILDSVIAERSLSSQDAGFIRTLAIGTTQMRGSLDHAIDHFASRPSSIEPRVRDALRMATYEILFMHTPHEIAVDQGVEAVRASTPRATGLANAILRRVSDEADTFPWDTTGKVERTALLTGHPEWLVDRLETDLGIDTAQSVLAADNTPPPLFLGAILPRTSDEALQYALSSADAAPDPYGPPGCFRVAEPSRAIASDLLGEHHAFVSDAAAQTVAQLCVPLVGGHVVEIGAGRGTKSLAILSHAHRIGQDVALTCIDSDPKKLDELAARLTDSGYASPSTMTLDAAAASFDSRFLHSADAVLIDAPCSGLGTLRRHPEKRWDLTPSAIDSLALLQHGMLANACQLVRPGGFMVYSTCTLLRVENDDVITSFLDSELGADFTEISLSDKVPEEFRCWITDEQRMQTLPTEGGPDGHFAAALRRDT